MSRHYKNLADTKRWLRKNFPLNKTPVIVKVVNELDGCHGVCLIGDGRALIKIVEASEDFMVEVLLEEYAHVIRDECPMPLEDDHDPLFWAILSQITRKLRGEL